MKTYQNPQGVFGSVADDQAFAEAPPTPGGVVPPVFPQPPAAGRCTPTATVLCELNRFAVTAVFVDPASGVRNNVLSTLYSNIVVMNLARSEFAYYSRLVRQAIDSAPIRITT